MDLKTENLQLISVLDYAISCLIHDIHVEAAYFSFQNTFFYKFRMINPSSLFSFSRKYKYRSNRRYKQAADTRFAAAWF